MSTFVALIFTGIARKDSLFTAHYYFK